MAKTQTESIVFQNQSHLVQRHYQNCGICPDLLDICLATDLMVEFGTKGFSKELKDRFDKMEIYLNSKYKNDKKVG